MSEEVHYSVRDGVAVLRLQRGTANALSPRMRSDLMAALDRAEAETDVRSVVITGAGAVFCSGVDLAEFDAPFQTPWVMDVTRRIELFDKPVVAVLHGAALGAGFELALAAHDRVAQTGCRLALPEVGLGLIPVGGSTQRLPRLIGAQAALELLLSGRASVAKEPRLSGLFSEVTQDPPLEAGLKLARALAGHAPKRSRDVTRGLADPHAFQSAIAEIRSQVRDPQSAEWEILRCVEAAQLLPFDQGLAFEASCLADRAQSEMARAIRHIYTAERKVAMARPSAQAVKIQTVAVIGQDELAVELAIHALDRGSSVTLLGPDEDTAEDLSARVREIYDNAVARGRLAADVRDRRLDRLDQDQAPRGLDGMDLVMDAGGVDVSSAQIKKGAVWAQLDGSSISAKREGGVVMHAYRPAHSASLVELAPGDDTSGVAMATLTDFFSSRQCRVVPTQPVDGLLGQRLSGAGWRAALMLCRCGVDPFDVDAAARSLGFGQGPFYTMDAMGLAASETQLRRLFGPVPELDLLVARGKAMVRGETQGRGFYASEGQNIIQDQTVQPWIQHWRAEQSDVSRVPDVPVETAFHAALVKAAIEAIGSGAAVRASDIDLVCVSGLGFARTKGGPLLQADLRGLLTLVRALKALEPVSDEIWGPHPALDEMVKFGKRFF